jgi:hypothetical protein
MERLVRALRRRRLAARGFGAAAVLMLWGAGPAHAHTAQILLQESTLIYQQFTGISLDRNNDVTISENTEPSGAYYVVDDPQSTGMFFPPQCTPLNTDQTSVSCPASGITGLYVRVGNAAKPDPTRTSTVTITAPTPATVSGGSATVDAGTSNVTVGPVGGNVLYGSLGGGTLNSRNGFVDFVHTCPPSNTIEADLTDVLIPDCAAIPEPPGTPPSGTPSPGSPAPSPSGPGSPEAELPPSAAPSAVVAMTFTQPQAVLGRRFIVFTVSVAMALTVRAHGSIALPSRATPLPLTGTAVRLGAPGATARLRLRLPKRTIKMLRRAFARHRRLYADVQLEATRASSPTSFSLARRIRIVP